MNGEPVKSDRGSRYAFTRDVSKRRSSMRGTRKFCRRFSIENDTEANFRWDGPKDLCFHGPYTHIRRTLDYKYHVCYEKERQWLQDAIIDKLINEVVVPNDCSNSSTTDIHHTDTMAKSTHMTENLVNVELFDDSSSYGTPQNSTRNSLSRKSNGSLQIRNTFDASFSSRKHSEMSLEKLDCITTDPILVYAVGTKDVPKFTTLSLLLEKERFPILSFVLVDPMEIQSLLPEYESYVQQYGESEAVQLMSKESGYIAEIVTRAALQNGNNAIVFTRFQNVNWYPKYFQSLRREFDSLKIAILHFLSKDESIICDSDPFDYHSPESWCIFATVAELIPTVEFHCLLKMSTDEHNGDDIEILTKDTTWSSIYTQFQQRSASVEYSRFLSGITNSRGSGSGKNFIRPFDVYKSTEENYKSDDMMFYGAYAHLRKTLDYTYHKNYRKDRQILQDAIIGDTLDAPRITDYSGQVCTTPTEPFLVFTAGAMGAGKSHTLDFINERGSFPLSGFVLIDPDQVRQRLPEFSLLIAQDQLTAGELTRKEAGYVVEILTLAALQSGKNVLVDTSLRDYEWYKQYFDKIRKEYPKVKLAILHIVAPREAVFQRAEARGKLTGRVVPRKTLEMAFEQVPKSVEILREKVDIYCALCNAPNQEIKILTKDMTWERFKQLWVQACAWIPKTRKNKTTSDNR
jgi:predicted kinase